MTMKPFHDIESLRHLVESVNKHCEYNSLEVKPTVKFRGTVKLHGSNGGVRVTPDAVVAQGRNRELSIQSDNFGFAHFVAGREGHFRFLADQCNGEGDTATIYGEWCGQGIQKGVAVASLPKMFVVFAIHDHAADSWVDIHALNLDAPVLDSLNADNIYLITQAPVFELEIDFNNPLPAAEEISRLTLQVEEVCPFGKLLGVEGTGEGIVWNSHNYPVHLTFKSKGEKHKKGGPKNHVPVDPEKVANIGALVDLLLPEWRLEQGFSYLRENNIPVANTSTGDYLKWISKDILKEEGDRIAANPYPWKEIVGTVMTRAKAYYFDKLNEMAGLPSASTETA